ncbi:MAG: hypothetical protein ACE37F_14575 [Nannocystaceae bacterium]|nr:hypothetical protein [bacterium]
MQEKRYELTLTPTQAIAMFSEAEVVDALYGGGLQAAGGEVRGSVITREDRLVLEAKRFRSFQWCVPLTARVEVDLESTERGASFSLRRIPPRLHEVAEFRRVLIVAFVSFAAVAWFSPLVAAAVLTTQLVAVALVWLINRRGIRAVNDMLVSLVWTVWAPALRDSSAAVYRGLAAAQP